MKNIIEIKYTRNDFIVIGFYLNNIGPSIYILLPSALADEFAMFNISASIYSKFDCIVYEKQKNKNIELDEFK